MKRIFLFLAITSAATTFSISSCNKDEGHPLINSNPVYTPSEPHTIDLIASRWNKIAPGVYTCSFINIIPPAYRNNLGVKVYCVNADQKMQIDYPIHFMGGELSATTTASDVTINYRCYTVLPFDHLDIVVEIRQEL